MWEILGAGGISSGTPTAVREDSDWIQPGPGGPMGSEHASCRAALPGQAGTWFTEQSVVHIFLLTMFHEEFFVAGKMKNFFKLVYGVLPFYCHHALNMLVFTETGHRRVAGNKKKCSEK